MLTVEQMLAHEEIRQLMATYNTAGDSGRRDDFAAVFTDDAVLTVPNATYETKKGIVAGVFSAVQGAKQSGATPTFRRMRHHLTTSRVVFTGPDTAKGRTYFFVITDDGPDHSGLYVDEFRREGDHWLIAKREVRVEYMDAKSPFAQKTPSDPSY